MCVMRIATICHIQVSASETRACCALKTLSERLLEEESSNPWFSRFAAAASEQPCIALMLRAFNSAEEWCSLHSGSHRRVERDIQWDMVRSSKCAIRTSLIQGEHSSQARLSFLTSVGLLKTRFLWRCSPNSRKSGGRGIASRFAQLRLLLLPR